MPISDGSMPSLTWADIESHKSTRLKHGRLLVRVQPSQRILGLLGKSSYPYPKGLISVWYNEYVSPRVSDAMIDNLVEEANKEDA